MCKRSKSNHIFNLLLVLAISVIVPALVFARGSNTPLTVTPLTPESTFEVQVKKPLPGVKALAPAQEELVSVIVKLKGESLATYSGGVPGLAPTSPRATAMGLDVKSQNSQAYLNYLAEKHSDFEASTLQIIPQVQITHRFDVILNAVAMLVPADQVKTLAELPDVEAVYPDELLHLDTDNSPQFLGAPTVWTRLGGQESAGEGVIVGVLDTGIWPEHPSFSDPDPSGKLYSPPPPPPSGTRACQFTGGANPGPLFACNNKLIGAQRFMATYDALISVLPSEFTSARDNDGHGTHTSSTAAGNAGVQASIYGIPRGIVSGIAPRAYVIMYKVCGDQGCYSSDSAAAVQEAINDGVNVINFSISGGRDPYSDAVSLAFLDAFNAGVFVAASAGNSGPSADTTDHREPWVTTVAASTQNRAFENTVTVTANGGASMTLQGASITQGVGPAPLYVPAADQQCNNPFVAGSLAGQVAVCKRGVSGRAQKGYNVLQGGAIGMILYNQAANVTDLETDNHYLPAAHIQFAQGQALLTFMSSHTNVQATLTQGAKVSALGDVMASFSSRGGPGQTLGVSKPDITAPGVQILAGHSPQHVPPPDGVALGPEGELFQAIAGTSMSSPHIAGAGALLKALHPDWTPARIKSAIMTTAKTAIFKEDGVTPANPFDCGSGRIDLTKAGDPGLTFDETGAHYVALKDELWNANYPGLYVPAMPGVLKVKRTVHSELSIYSCWSTSADEPSDMNVSVTPPVICIRPGGSATFSISVDVHDVPIDQVRHATLKLTSFPRTLHFPITIVRKQQVVTLTKSCTPASFPKGSTTSCTITMSNTSFDKTTAYLIDYMPWPLNLVHGSLTGAIATTNGLLFLGVLSGVGPPDVAIGPGTSPAGYLPLSAFGVAPIAGVGDDTITNFNVPAFKYAGETYTRLGVVSNGYLVVGGGTGADVTINNQNLPNPAPPNNVLAPFWTDLNPAAGGAIRIATLTDGVNTWIVVDWHTVKEFSTAKTDSFEVWIGINGTEDISFAYGAIGGNGDLGLLTVGAENKFGNRGGNYYYNGAGTLPNNVTELRVTGTPGAPGGTHVVTFSAKGLWQGNWENCAQMGADIFDGISSACFNGTVTP